MRFRREDRLLRRLRESAERFLESGELPSSWEPRGDPRVVVDERGVMVHTDAGRDDTIQWSELAEVTIRTTDTGPWAEDVFWVLLDENGRGCVVPLSSPAMPQLLKRLDSLPGFDTGRVIDAMASATDDTFVCWRRPR